MPGHPADAQLLVKGPLQAALRMESLGLDPPILEAVRALGIEEFTEPQVRAIPRILAGANALLVRPPDILITTPETFQILFTGRKLREHLRSVRWVVVDEIHELASDERGAQLAVGLERLRDLTGRDFQRVGLSATVGAPEEVGAFLGGVDRRVEVIRVRIPKGLRIRVEMPTTAKEDSEIAERLRVK